MDSSSETLSVAVCQMTAGDDVSQNVDQILRQLKSLEDAPPAIICFPENCLYMRVKEGQAIPPISLGGSELRKLAIWAKTHSATIHLGSVPLAGQHKLYNSTVVIRPSGAIEDVYQKIHLFDVDVAGHKSVRESDVFNHGTSPVILDVDGWKIGSAICYDLRFAELFLQYAKAEVDAIVLPAAFLVPTGEAHWHVLLRARAIESQCYVLAAAQGGTHRGSGGEERRTFGHSMVVDPWGKVLGELPESVPSPEAGVLRATLERSRLLGVRRQIPMRHHRRL